MIQQSFISSCGFRKIILEDRKTEEAAVSWRDRELEPVVKTQAVYQQHMKAKERGLEPESGEKGRVSYATT